MGEINFDLKVNQDSIDAYYLAFPNGQSYLNNALEITKEGYNVSQLKQDTAIFYTFRPFFQADKLITTYMYKSVPFKIEFSDVDKNQANRILSMDIKCYPKHPKLDYDTFEGRSTYILEADPRDFTYNTTLAAISYDINIIVKDPVQDIEVLNQTFSVIIDNVNTANNVIKVDYWCNLKIINIFFS